MPNAQIGLSKVSNRLENLTQYLIFDGDFIFHIVFDILNHLGEDIPLFVVSQPCLDRFDPSEDSHQMQVSGNAHMPMSGTLC